MALKVGELYGVLKLDDSQFQQKMDKAESSFLSLGTLTKKVAPVVAGALTAVSGVIGKVGLEFEAMKETSLMAWETILKSAQAAKKMISDIQKLAKETPFEFEGLDKSAKLLVAMGIDAKKTIPYLRAIADATAAVGGNTEMLEGVAMAIGQIATKGKVSAEEMNQLAERGIPAWEILSQQLGKSKQELMELSSQGKLFAEEAIPALIRGLEERFGGASQKLATTWQGLIAQISDSFKILASRMVPFEQAKRVLQEILNILDGINASLDKGGWRQVFRDFLPPSVAESIIGGIEKIKQAMDDLGQSFDDFGDWAKKIKDKIQQGDWTGVGKALGDGLAQMLKSVGDLGAQIADWLVQQFKNIDWMAVGRDASSMAIGFVIGFVGGLLDPGTWISFVTQYWDELLIMILGIMFSPAKWIAKLNEYLGKIPIVGEMLKWITEKLNEIGTKAKEFGKSLFRSMGQGFTSSLGEGMREKFGDTFILVRGWLDGMKQRLAERTGQFGETARQWMFNIGQNIGTFANSHVIPAVRNMLSGIDVRFTAFLEKARQHGANIVRWFKTGFDFAWNSFLKPLGQLVNLIARPFIDAAKKAYSWGRDIVYGIGRGIESGIGWVVDKVQNLASRIAAKIRDFFGIRSPSRLMKKYGQYIVQGLHTGIEQSSTGAINATAQLAKSVLGIVNDATEGMTRRSISGAVMRSLAPRPAFAAQTQFAAQPAASTINITIQSMSVRNENDIRKIAQELHRLQTAKMRSMGVL